MTDIRHDIQHARDAINKAYQDVLIASKLQRTEDERHERLLKHMKMMMSACEDGHEAHYLAKLYDAFSDMNMASIHYFVESNYDRYDEIRKVMNKFDDNFEADEFAQYDARHVVLEKLMFYLVANDV
jgi:hypothetical protein